MQFLKIDKKYLIISLILILFTVTGYFFLPSLMQPSFEDIMHEPTIMLNKTGMQMIDRETRFDSGMVLSNKTFQYNYTLINHDSSSLNIAGFKKDIYPILLDRLKSDSNFQILRINEAKIVYNYKDKNGKTLFKLVFTPAQYLSKIKK